MSVLLGNYEFFYRSATLMPRSGLMTALFGLIYGLLGSLISSFELIVLLY